MNVLGRLFRWRSRRSDQAFPQEVLNLRERQGIPLPTWFAGPLYPEDGAEAAQQEFEKYVERAPESGVTDE